MLLEDMTSGLYSGLWHANDFIGGISSVVPGEGGKRGRARNEDSGLKGWEGYDLGFVLCD